MGDMVSDMICVIQHAQVKETVCIGLAALSFQQIITEVGWSRHDWGSQICYEAARMRPDLLKGVVGAVVPVRLDYTTFLTLVIHPPSTFTRQENLLQLNNSHPIYLDSAIR